MRKVLVAAIVLACSAARALATPAGADAEAKLADAAAASQDFITAAAHYKAAYAQDPRPDLICNAGVAYYKAKDMPRAHLYLSRCQERGTALDATFVSSVRTALAAVENQLRTGLFTPVDIVTRPEGASVTVASLGATDTFTGPRLVWLPRGPQRLTARAEGYDEKTVDIDAEGTQRQAVDLTLSRTAAPAPPTLTPDTTTPPASTQTPQTPQTASEPAAPRTEPPRRPSKVPAIVALGGTVVALAVAGVAYTQAQSAADMAPYALTQSAFDDDKSSATTWNRVMGVSGVLGLIGAGASAYFVLRW